MQQKNGRPGKSLKIKYGTYRKSGCQHLMIHKDMIIDDTIKFEEPTKEEVLNQDGYQLNDSPESAPVKRGRGRPRKKRGPKPKTQESSHQGQSTAPEIKEPKVQERWRQLVNIIPEASVWVSDQGGIRLGVLAKKELNGSITVNLCGAWVPLDQLVYAAFGEPSKNPEWKQTVLQHKNGDLRDNTFSNLEPVKLKCSQAQAAPYHPTVTPNDVMN